MPRYCLPVHTLWTVEEVYRVEVEAATQEQALGLLDLWLSETGDHPIDLPRDLFPSRPLGCEKQRHDGWKVQASALRSRQH